MTNTNLIKTLLASVAITASAHATAIVIPNFSFETPDGGVDLVTATASFQSNPNASWLRSGNWGVQDWVNAQFAGSTGDASVLPGTADGYQAAFMSSGATIFQDLGVLLPNTEYTFTVAVGNRLDRADSNLVTLSLINGNNLSGNVLVTGASTTSPADGTFEDFSVSFTSAADVTGNLVIAINSHTASSQLVIDNVRLDASAIPEPSAFAALAGIVGLGFAASRRRRSA